MVNAIIYHPNKQQIYRLNMLIPKVQRIRDLKGMGPKSEQQLQVIGIKTVKQFMQEDPFDIYARLKTTADGISLNFLYAIIGAQEGLPWQAVAQQRRTAILLRLDDMGIAP